MAKIRKGFMRDCIDLLEVYQGTRWFYRQREGGYITVEQVKDEHRGAAFARWGWLVAEEDGRVIGEIVFRAEKNPNGKIGVIRNLDVDVRKQKATIGTQLTRAAEEVMRKKRVVRVVATTPPAAYNYWMKVGYFARGKILMIEKPISRIPVRRTGTVKTLELQPESRIPKSMRFSNISYPGLLANVAGVIADGDAKGRLLEFSSQDKLVGVGAVMLSSKKQASFVADVTQSGRRYSDVVISRTARAARKLRAKRVGTTIPKGQFSHYEALGKWTHEESTGIPVTRLL
jgi:GNAT superfamily N-acetyltransferase